MVEDTLRSAIKVEHKLEHLAQSAEGGSQDDSEKAFHEMRHLTEQAALSAIKEAEKWGKEALSKAKEFTEDMTI